MPIYSWACFAFRAWDPDLSQPDIGIEFLNWLFLPQAKQTPSLVGPFGLSISH